MFAEFYTMFARYCELTLLKLIAPLSASLKVKASRARVKRGPLGWFVGNFLLRQGAGFIKRSG